MSHCCFYFSCLTTYEAEWHFLGHNSVSVAPILVPFGFWKIICNVFFFFVPDYSNTFDLFPERKDLFFEIFNLQYEWHFSWNWFVILWCIYYLCITDWQIASRQVALFNLYFPLGPGLSFCEPCQCINESQDDRSISGALFQTIYILTILNCHYTSNQWHSIRHNDLEYFGPFSVPWVLGYFSFMGHLIFVVAF